MMKIKEVFVWMNAQKLINHILILVMNVLKTVVVMIIIMLKHVLRNAKPLITNMITK